MTDQRQLNIETIKQLNCRDFARQLLGEPVRQTQKFDRYYSPFRQDGRKPSLTVYETSIKDFGGSGQSWDIIAFVMDLLNLNFMDACQYLVGNSAHISTVTPQKQSQSAQAPTHAWQVATMQQVIKYEKILWQSPTILDYLRHERGLSDKTIQQYRLGYNPTWDEFRVEDQVCKVAPGVTIPWLTADTLYAVRVRTRTGALAIASKHDDSYLDNKYMSITGSRQSAGLFGADGIQPWQTILITEGEFDAMLASQTSNYRALTRGSASDHHNITDDWLEKLGSAEIIYGILDTDEAGQSASDALLKKLDNFIPLRLPSGKDISEYLLHNHGDIQAIFAYIEQAKAEAETRRQALLEPDDIFVPQYTAPQFKATVRVNVPYISKAHQQIPQAGVVVLTSDKGTGKTHYGAQIVRTYRDKYKSVMAITPFRSLTAAAGEQYQLEHYNSLTWSQWLQTSSLAITLKSIGNFGTMGNIPTPQLLVLDEFSKMLEQLHSSIYQKNEASQVYTVLKYMIAKAEQVLIMDADIGVVEIDWLRLIRTDVHIIVNEFNRSSGNLFIHATRDTLRDKFIHCLGDSNRQQRPIAFFANTASEVQTLELYLRDKTNYKILSISSQNSSNIEQQRFLKNPDKYIERYDAVLISPSAMTGIDIQTQVYAKFGHFNYSPKQTPSATGCAQLLERARNADNTHIWVEQADGKAEESAFAIYESYRLSALRSDIFLMGLEVDDLGQLNLSGVTKEVHQLQSQLIARDNASRNKLYENLLNLLARNYLIQTVTGTSNIHKEEIKALAKTRKETWDKLVCSTEAIDDERLNELIAEGIVTEKDHAGNARYHIEEFYNQVIDKELYAFDKEGKGRYRISNYTQAMLIDESILANLDNEERDNETPLTARQFRTMKARTIKAFIQKVWGSKDAFLENPSLPMRYIAERTEEFLEDYAEDVRLYFKYRHDHSDESWNTAKRLLRRFGLNFKQIRSRDASAPKQYQIDPTTFAYVQRLAHQHLTGVTKKRNSIVSSPRFLEAAA